MRTPDISHVQKAQHGLAARRQVLSAGMTDAEIKSLVRQGLWIADQAGVYAPSGAPLTPSRRLMAAVLAGGLGTLASHRSAAWLWGLLDEPDRPEVTTTRSRAPRPRGTIAHRLLDMADANVSLRQGIPVTNPLRTLVDLGAVVPTSRLRNAVHVAVADRLVTYAGLEAELARLAKPGRWGVGPLRVVLGERFDRTRSPSVLESRMDRVIAAANVPRPEIERIVGSEGEYRTDYRWQEVLLILEAKGFAAHGSPEAASRDFERELAITEAGGYQILSVGWDQATRGARKLARQLNSIYHSRRQLLLGA